MAANRTVTLSREELDRLTSAFSALPFIIEHCDSTCAGHVARIFEKYAFDVFDEADRADQTETEGGEA